jgi:thioredoxin reductase
VARVVVIGAGPIGLAAAIGASDRGHDVVVLEADDVGASLQTWGATRFFTPLSMNVMFETADDSLLTGQEYVERVLRPLAARLNVRTKTRVLSISRRGLTRTDYAGHPLRAEKPFRIQTTGDDVIEADIVFDATGSTSPIPLHVRNNRTIRTIGELQRADVRGKSVLLAGHGHSAAHAVAMLHEAGAKITWAVRTANRRPCEEIANDPLPERKRVVTTANDLAQSLRVERRAMIERVDGRNVTLSGNRIVDADVIVALTGYRPLNGFTTELALETSPVTEGGARLHRAIARITDCLSVPKVALSDLESGEPNYFFVGARAYGRSRTFLLQTGFAQVETILESLHV